MTHVTPLTPFRELVDAAVAWSTIASATEPAPADLGNAYGVVIDAARRLAASGLHNGESTVELPARELHQILDLAGHAPWGEGDAELVDHWRERATEALCIACEKAQARGVRMCAEHECGGDIDNDLIGAVQR